MQRKVVICLLVCLFLVPCAWGHSNKMCWDGDKIRVLDWNVYIGTDVVAGVHELTNLQLPYKETGFVNVLDRGVYSGLFLFIHFSNSIIMLQYK